MARIAWEALPESVLAWAEGVLGARVVAAESQQGGFSPGAAARLRLSDGSSAFGKAVSVRANPDSPRMHRREAEIAAALPSAVPAPRFLGTYDDGDWVALLFAAVDGCSPALPWRRPELELVLAAIREMHEACTPPPVPGLPTVAEYGVDAFSGWRSLAGASAGAGVSACTSAGASGNTSAGASGNTSARGSTGASVSAESLLSATLTAADPWVLRHLDRLAALEATWPDAAVGDTLLHNDLRADNVLIGPDRVWLVDWPLACTGAAWIDIAFMAPSVAMDGGPDPEWLMTRTVPADPDALIAVVAALAGFFTRAATLPAPPGLPTLRAFQERQAVPAVAWLRRLTRWP